jgi:hypothetical protein
VEDLEDEGASTDAELQDGHVVLGAPVLRGDDAPADVHTPAADVHALADVHAPAAAPASLSAGQPA